ncbi:MAG TPA: hypothetical protein VFE50_05940 [Cyclobacteriaceae bacterium]|nr:hypothetical protein [Cyclobacteriaceae bacterium]
MHSNLSAIGSKTSKVKILVWGFVISFLGSLPPGTTNVIMMQLSATKGYTIAGWFAVGCMVAEVVCVYVCVKVMDRISQSRLFIKSLEWVSLLVIVWLVISSFSSVKEVPIPKNMPPVIFGFLLMAINPVQIPFWVGWTTILIESKRLPVDGKDNALYILGIAVGSIAASLLFILGGRGIAAWIDGQESLFQWTFGIALVLIAMVQVVKIIRNRRPEAKPTDAQGPGQS